MEFMERHHCALSRNTRGKQLLVRNLPIALLKKLDWGGKDRPPGIISRRDRNMAPAEKTPEPWPPSLTARSTAHSATAQPEGGAQDIDPREWAGHSERIFLTKPKIRPRGGLNQ
jgi:hypothetical protein